MDSEIKQMCQQKITTVMLETHAYAFAYQWKPELNERSLLFRLAQKLRQLGENGGNSLGLVTRKQLATPKATRLLFEKHVGKGLPVGVLHHKAAIQFLD
jgi:hypothetical protein